ncbi:MAG: hypothetical protein ACD_14C00013G0002, partial [uncultured bacterium]
GSSGFGMQEFLPGIFLGDHPVAKVPVGVPILCCMQVKVVSPTLLTSNAVGMLGKKGEVALASIIQTRVGVTLE